MEGATCTYEIGWPHIQENLRLVNKSIYGLPESISKKGVCENPAAERMKDDIYRVYGIAIIIDGGKDKLDLVSLIEHYQTLKEFYKNYEQKLEKLGINRNDEEVKKNVENIKKYVACYLEKISTLRKNKAHELLKNPHGFSKDELEYLKDFPRKELTPEEKEAIRLCLVKTFEEVYKNISQGNW